MTRSFINILFSLVKLQLLGNGESSKKGIAKRTWEAIVANARECPPGNELYSYNVDGQRVTLIFNLVYELLGAKLDGHYDTISNFSAPRKVHIRIQDITPDIH